jgi:hypothetical protein
MQWEVFARGCLASLTLLDFNHFLTVDWALKLP